MISKSITEKSVQLRPNAKINLGLIIKGKRSDGYHLLETVFIPVFDLCDQLSLRAIEGPESSLIIQGMELDGELKDNLCLKAYRLLKQQFPALPAVEILLEKGIPAGAGLGGGSSDAAATLSGLNDLFALGQSREELARLGAKLGADVPFFLYNRPLLAKGIGTEFEEIALDFPYRIKVVTSAIHSATAGVFGGLDHSGIDYGRDLRQILQQDAKQWRDLLVNDLEKPVFALYPELAETKRQLYAEGAVYAAMSGSGSAVFGLF